MKPKKAKINHTTVRIRTKGAFPSYDDEPPKGVRKATYCRWTKAFNRAPTIPSA